MLLALSDDSRNLPAAAFAVSTMYANPSRIPYASSVAVDGTKSSHAPCQVLHDY